MSTNKLQLLRCFLTERITAAAVEIFGEVESVVEEYRDENKRLQQMLRSHREAARFSWNKARTSTTGLDSLPPHLLCEEEVHPEQQERSPGLLRGLEQADAVELTLYPVPVKSEHDEEKPQSSWFNQTQTEENREAEPLASTSTGQMKTEPDGEDCGVSEPASNLDPAGDLEPTREGQLLSSDCSGTEPDNMDDGWNSRPRKPQPTKTQKRQRSSNAINGSMGLSPELKSYSHTPAKRNRKTTSAIWEHFTTSPTDTTNVVCKLCRATISRGRDIKHLTTSVMHNHMHFKHPALTAAAHTDSRTFNGSTESPHELKSSGHTPAKKNRRTTSAIWEHFAISPSDRTNVICKLCMVTLSRGRDMKHLTTSVMHNHMHFKHPAMAAAAQAPPVWANAQPASSLSPIMAAFNSKTLYHPDSHPTARQMTETVGEMICQDLLPYSTDRYQAPPYFLDPPIIP